MPRHPHPDVLADHLRRLADLLDQPKRRCTHDGPCRPGCPPPTTAGHLALTLATQLAARGYPTATLGTGARSSSDSTSTERAALDPHPWADIDDQLAATLRKLWHTAATADGLIARLVAHASDDDLIPAGRGHCQACETFCIGDGHNDRLRDGFCHPCRSAWDRWRRGHPLGLRPDFIRNRRRVLGMATNSQAVGA